MNINELDKKHIWHPYTQMKTCGDHIAIVKGEGSRIVDSEGNVYIDAISSWWVNLHGHSHPYIAKKVYEQMTTLEHVMFGGFTHEPATQIAHRLTKHLPSNQQKFFFSDNGSTAVETALKITIQYWKNKGKTKTRFLAFENAFHGDTFGAMSTSGRSVFHEAFSDLLFEVAHLAVPTSGNEEKTIAALEKELERDDIAGFIYEPLVQGAAGMICYEPEILNEMLVRCKEKGVLCISDEVMTGFYRTGTFMASQQCETPSDILCMSKGLTGGALPMALTSCTQEIYDVFLDDSIGKAFLHGHSFTANPIGCATAIASLDLLEKEECLERIRTINKKHLQFKDEIATHPMATKLYVRGTIFRMEFKQGEAASYDHKLRDQLYDFFMDKGLLLRPLGNIVYILPPYCITDEELDEIYSAIREALDHFTS